MIRRAFLFATCCLSLPCLTFADNIIDSTPGLVYHLDAGVNVTSGGGAVTGWADESGSGLTFSQSTVAKQPTYNTSDPTFNNLPSISFNGSSAGETSPPFSFPPPNSSQLLLNAATNAQTVFLVLNSGNNSPLAGVWGENLADTGIRMSNANAWQFNGTGGNGNTNDFGTSMSVNGVPGGAAPANTSVILAVQGNAALSATGLGDYFSAGSNNAPRPWAGSIAEVAVYNSTLSTPQIDGILSYLGGKYDIAVAVPEPGSMLLAALGVGGMFMGARRRRVSE